MNPKTVVSLILAVVLSVATAYGGMRKAGGTGSTIYGYQSYADIDGFVGSFCEITPEGDITAFWEYSYSSSGASLGNGWIRDGVLCGLGIFTAGSEDLVGDYAYQEFDLKSGRQITGRRIDVDGDFTPYFYKAAYVPGQDRIYGFGRVGDPYKSEKYAFKSAPAAHPEDAVVVSEIEPGDRCYSLCWHPVDKCFYGVTTWGKFVRILTDGTMTELFEVPVGNLANSSAAMAYSPYDGYLLWNPVELSTVSNLYAVYPAEGRVEKLHTFDVDRQFSFFVIPDFEVEDSAPGRGKYLGHGFKDGSTTGTLEFSMPLSSVGGDVITAPMGWVLYGNGEKIAQGSASPGEKVSVALNNLPEAYYTFRFDALLGGKSGAPCVAHLYVGNDIPATPGGVVLTETSVTWNPVSEGVHGGYVDASAMSYKVSLNGKEIGTTNGTSLSYVLDPELELNAYRAGVVATSAGKDSNPGMSSKVLMGRPMSLPVTIGPTVHQADLVTVINRDGSPDYGVWRYSEQWDLPCFASGWSHEQPDDWLILPVTHFPSSDYAYNFAIDAARGGYIGTHEYFEVWVGAEPLPEAMTIPVMSKTRAQKYNQWVEYNALFAIPAPGDYYVAIRGVSNPDQKDLIVRNIRISESHESTQAPESVSGLEVIRTDDANYTAVLGFRMPEKYIDGTSIPDNMEIKVTVNAASETVLSGAPGASQRVTVSTAQGDNYITVVPSIGGREGHSSEVVVFTGVDMLGFVENLRARETEDNMGVHFTWEAPKESINGGYFSTTGITYYAAEINELGELIGDAVKLGTDVYEATFRYPEGTPQASRRIAVIPENAAGLSNARSFHTLIVGTPYTLPVKENFDDMQMTYSPLVVQRPSTAYAGGQWTWCQPELVNPDFAHTSPYALIGYTEEQARVRMRLPKVSTVGISGSTVTFEVWAGNNAAESITVYAITHGMSAPEQIATIPAGDGWVKSVLDLPERFMDCKWMNLYIDGYLPSAENYLIVAGYSMDDHAGVHDSAVCAGTITSGEGSVLIRGFDGHIYMVVSPDGRVISTGTATGDCEVDVAPGFYIVKCGRVTARVLVR